MAEKHVSENLGPERIPDEVLARVRTLSDDDLRQLLSGIAPERLSSLGDMGAGASGHQALADMTISGDVGISPTVLEQGIEPAHEWIARIRYELEHGYNLPADRVGKLIPAERGETLDFSTNTISYVDRSGQLRALLVAPRPVPVVGEEGVLRMRVKLEEGIVPEEIHEEIVLTLLVNESGRSEQLPAHLEIEHSSGRVVTLHISGIPVDGSPALGSLPHGLVGAEYLTAFLRER